MTDIVIMDLRMLEKGIYKISKALVDIVDEEGTDYGYAEAVEMAERYVKRYEEDHPEVNHDKES